MASIVNPIHVTRLSKVIIKDNKFISLGMNSYVVYQNIKICKECNYITKVICNRKDISLDIKYQDKNKSLGCKFKSEFDTIVLRITFNQKGAYLIDNIRFINLDIMNIVKPLCGELRLNELVECVYVLNRDVDIDRMNKVTLELKSNKIDFFRFSAIDGSNLEDIEGKYNRYEYGCYLSHLSIYKDAYSKNYNSICILEDDILFSPNFKSELFHFINSIPKWDILYLGCSQKVNTWNELNINYNLGYYRSIKCNGTFAYCIKRDILGKLIDIVEKNKDRIDTILHSIQEKYACYTVLPNIVISDVSKSIIREGRNQAEISEQNGWIF